MGKMILNGKEYAGSGSEWHEYSTEEKVVGTWIDGKPLYEVTVKNVNLSHNSWTTVFSGSSKNAVVRRAWGGIGIDGNTTTAYCDINYYRSTNEFACASINSNVNILANIAAPECLIYGIIQYTKTTD